MTSFLKVVKNFALLIGSLALVMLPKWFWYSFVHFQGQRFRKLLNFASRFEVDFQIQGHGQFYMTFYISVCIQAIRKISVSISTILYIYNFQINRVGDLNFEIERTATLTVKIEGHGQFCVTIYSLCLFSSYQENPDVYFHIIEVADHSDDIAD